MIVSSSGRVVAININPIQILHTNLFIDLQRKGDLDTLFDKKLLQQIQI